MRNDDLTKLARWIVPGWLTFLTFLSFVVIDLLVSTSGGKSILSPADFNKILEFLKDNQISSSSEAFLATIIGITASVPVGFIVYQAYFFLRWNSPFSRDGLLSLIPGREREIKKSTQHLHNELTLGNPWRQEIIDNELYETDHSFKYRYIEALFIEACQTLDKDTEVSVFSRHRYLHEVVHTLGASIGALYIGFFGYLITRLMKEGLNASIYLPITFFLTVLFFGLMNIEDEWRNKKAEEIKKGKIPQGWEKPPVLHFDLGKTFGFSFPSSQLLLTFVFFHFFGNPSFSPPEVPIIAWPPPLQVFNREILGSQLVLRIFLSFLIFGIWAIPPHGKPQKKYLAGSFIWAALTIIACLLIVFIPKNFSWVDWAFFFNFTLFLTASLILFSNRRNASDDMLLLEYYTIRRYLDSKKTNKTTNSTSKNKRKKE